MNTKNVFCGAILFLFLFSLVSAAQIEVKDSVKKGESFIVKVNGNIDEAITKSQVKFLRQGYINTEFGNFEVEKLEDEYYFYLNIPLEKLADNYTIIIEDVTSTAYGETTTTNLEKTFTILDEYVPFRIFPPLIIAHEEYSVNVENIGPSTITIDLESTILPSEDSQVELNETNETQTNETVEEKESFFDRLFSSDEVNETTQENETNQTSPITGAAVTEGSITIKSGETKTVTFLAPKAKGFEKKMLYSNGLAYYVLVYNPEDRETLIKENEEETNETINETTNETMEVNETEIEENKTEQNESFIVDENGSIINKSDNKTIGNNLQNCSELNGTICDWGEEKCTSTPLQVKDGNCCLDDCVKIEESNTGKIVGWSIIIAIALFITWFFKKKYSKVSK